MTQTYIPTGQATTAPLTSRVASAAGRLRSSPAYRIVAPTRADEVIAWRGGLLLLGKINHGNNKSTRTQQDRNDSYPYRDAAMIPTWPVAAFFDVRHHPQLVQMLANKSDSNEGKAKENDDYEETENN